MTAIEKKDARLFVTGFGPVCAIGVGADAFTDAVRAAQCGIGEVTGFDVPEDGPQLAAEAAEYDVEPLLRSPKNYLDRNSQVAFGAVELALRHADLTIETALAERTALCAGSAFGNLETLELFNRNLMEKGPRLVPPFLFQHTYPNTTISLLSIEYGITGGHAQFCSGAAAGLMALASAAQMVRCGKADAALAGGMDALSRPAFMMWERLGRLSMPPDEGCRPFASSRNGTVLGEGAAFLLLESGPHAKERSAAPLAELVGVGVAGDPAEAMRSALQDAAMASSEVGLVFGSANGEVEPDRGEAEAIRAVFGDSACPPLVCLKSVIGETVGASGPLALCAAVAALQTGFVPPPPAAPQPEFPWIRGASQPPQNEAVLVNAFDSAGGCVSVVLRRGGTD